MQEYRMELKDDLWCSVELRNSLLLLGPSIVHLYFMLGITSWKSKWKKVIGLNDAQVMQLQKLDK